MRSPLESILHPLALLPCSAGGVGASVNRSYSHSRLPTRFRPCSVCTNLQGDDPPTPPRAERLTPHTPLVPATKDGVGYGVLRTLGLYGLRLRISRPFNIMEHETPPGAFLPVRMGGGSRQEFVFIDRMKRGTAEMAMPRGPGQGLGPRRWAGTGPGGTAGMPRRARCSGTTCRRARSPSPGTCR
jgi:hypothetical protein